MAKKPLVNSKVQLVNYDEAYGKGSQSMDGPVSWFVSICSSLSSLIVVGIIYSYGIFFPLILEEFQETKATTAFVGSLAMSIIGLLGPVSSKLIDRFGCLVIITCGGLTCAAGLLTSSFSPNIYVLFLAYGIGFGFGSCCVYIAAFQLIPLYFERHISVATGFASAGPGIGLLLMSPVIQTLLDYFDWRKTLMILAAVSLVTCFLGCSIKRRKIPKKMTTKEEVIREEAKSSLGCCSAPDFSVMKNPVFIVLSVTMSVACLGIAIPTVHLAKYAEDLEIPGHRSSWLYFTLGIASALSRIAIGKLCDSGLISLMHIFQAGVFLLGINNLLLPFYTSFELLIVYCCVYGFSEGLFVIPMNSTILKLFPEGFGWYMCFLCISYLIGPVFGGLIADLSGSYHPAFITSGVLFFISFFMPLLLKYVEKSDRKQVEMPPEKEGEVVVCEKVTVL